MATTVCNGVDYRKRFNGRPDYGFDSSTSIMQCQWLGDLTVETLQNLRLIHNIRPQKPVLALIYIYGDWITLASGDAMLADRLQSWFGPIVKDLECQVFCGKLQLTEDSVDELETLPPFELPALALVSQKSHATVSAVNYLSNPSPAVLLKALREKSRDSPSTTLIKQAIQNAVRQTESNVELSIGSEISQAAVRIFVAGDRSSVGKSSVCLYVPTKRIHLWVKLFSCRFLTLPNLDSLDCLSTHFTGVFWATSSTWVIPQRTWLTSNLPHKVNQHS